jgi:hypothetical protein
MHRECGKPGFYFTVEPVMGMAISTWNTRKLDGSGFELLEMMMCGSCGEPYGLTVIENIREE